MFASRDHQRIRIRNDPEQRAHGFSRDAGYCNVIPKAWRSDDIATNRSDLTDRRDAELLVGDKLPELRKACSAIALCRETGNSRRPARAYCSIDASGRLVCCITAASNKSRVR